MGSPMVLPAPTAPNSAHGVCVVQQVEKKPMICFGTVAQELESEQCPGISFIVMTKTLPL